MDLGVALLPRRCAIAEITSGRLAAVPVAQVRLPRHLRLVYPEQAQLSHAALAFIEIARRFEKDVSKEIAAAE
jgi:DNA-binding transcriptional LysR family regulator